jgi:hypothetical protein
MTNMAALSHREPVSFGIFYGSCGAVGISLSLCARAHACCVSVSSDARVRKLLDSRYVNRTRLYLRGRDPIFCGAVTEESNVMVVAVTNQLVPRNVLIL